MVPGCRCVEEQTAMDETHPYTFPALLDSATEKSSHAMFENIMFQESLFDNGRRLLDDVPWCHALKQDQRLMKRSLVHFPLFLTVPLKSPAMVILKMSCFKRVCFDNGCQERSPGTFLLKNKQRWTKHSLVHFPISLTVPLKAPAMDNLKIPHF